MNARISLLFLSCVLLSAVGCIEKKVYVVDTQEEKDHLDQVRLVDAWRLPKDAKNLKDLGNDWFTFELDDKKFLYFHHNAYSNHGVAGVTQIIETKE